MKRTGFVPRIILLSVFMSVFAIHVAAQKVSLSYKNVPFEKVLNSIKQQTGLSPVFSEQLVDLNRKVTVQLKSVYVEEALKQLLTGTNIDFEIRNNKLYLIEKKAKEKQVQDIKNKKEVSGVVVDEKNSPIIGATIQIDGMSKGTITDLNGRFNIEAPSDSKLFVSYVGYEKKRVEIGGNSTLKITLYENNKSLDEVVVVGYGTMKKRDLTGAVSSVKLNDVPVGTTSTISHMLAGTAAGLQVNTISAQPGGKSTFNIRGAASTGAGNDPLIVIDGFPISSSGEPASGNRYDGGSKDYILGSLNPNDIESIEVLKDASATAIYGARAGHGVIIITTKRGKKGLPVVKYSSSGAYQTQADNYKMLDAHGFMREVNNYSREKYLIDNKYYPYGIKTLTSTPNTTVYTDDQISNPVNNTNWLNEITRKGWQQQHNISINGGTDATQYQASLNYFNQDGVIKHNGMTRVSARVNLDQKISEFFKVGISSLMNQNIFNNVPLGSGANEYAGIIRSAVQFSPLLPVKDENGEYVLSPVRGFIPNPVSLLEISDKSIDERLLSVYYLEYYPIKDLKIKVNAGVDRKYRKRSTYLPTTTLYGKNANGDASLNQYDNRDYLVETTANYNLQVKNNKLNLLAGHSYQKFNGEGFSANNKDFVTDSYLYNNLGAGEYAKPVVGSWANKSSMASFFGRVNYSYMDKYLLTMTMRADGASNLAEGHQWGYFPSVATAWRFSDEPFMKKYKNILSNGKLRVSYGETGNSNIGNGAIDYYKSSVEYVFGESAYRGVELGQIGNKNLTWETTKEWNLGLDIGIYDRVNISAEYFDRQIVNLLNSRSLMTYFPLSTLADNIGTTQSHGFELTINSQNIVTKNFNWNSTVTFSTYRDTWKERADSWKPASYEGYHDPIRSAYGYLSDGLIQAGESVPQMPGSLAGQVKIKDIDSYKKDASGNIMVDNSGLPLKTGMPDGKLDDADKVFYGSYDPDFMIGFSNSFKYKNWDMSFYLYGTFNKLMNASYYDNWALGAPNIINDQNLPISVTDIWRSDNTASKRPGYTQMLSQYGIGDYYMRKISFVRVRNITLGYTVPFKKIISNLHCYVDINNPFLFTNYSGLDPETDNVDVAYPNVRTFSFGLDITF